MVSSLIGIVLGFTAMSVLFALKAPLWLPLLVAALVMCITTGGSWLLLQVLTSATTSSSTYDLLVASYMIAALIYLYRVTGYTKLLGEELVKVLRKPKLVVTVTPAVMGLLPIPGGALLSAPVVDSVGDSLGLSRKLKVFVNVWFRHVVFLAYPLNQAVITAAVLAGINVWSLVLRQLPAVLAMWLAGYLVAFRRAGSVSSTSVERSNPATLAKVLSPILVAVAIAASTSSILDRELIEGVPYTRYSMLLGLAVAIALLLFFAKPSWLLVLKALASKQAIEVSLAAFSIVVLREAFVKAGGSVLVAGIVENAGYTAKLFLLVAVPFMLSFSTGSPTVGVSIAIPVFQPALSVGLREVSLLYTSNMLGYIGSPAHLCYVYTAQYFKTTLTEAYREVLVSIALTMAAALLFYFFT